MSNIIDPQRRVLQRLIEDDKGLRELAKKEERINIFTIIKNGATEIRHSNILAWLLQVREHHGLGESFLREFIKVVIRNNPQKANILEWAFLDYSAQIVQTEDKNIDITIKFENTKHVIAIENKTKTSEHEAGTSGTKQTIKYRQDINRDYGDYTKLFVYLTPDGDAPADDDWCVISYEDILAIIEDLLKSEKLLSEVRLILSNYCSLIKSDVIGKDNEIFTACKDVYQKHKEALDLLLDYSNHKIKNKKITPENAELCGRVYSLYENEIELIRKNQIDEVAILALKLSACIRQEENLELSDAAGKTYIMFSSKELDQYLPRLDSKSSSWNTTNTYHFWFYTGHYKEKKILRLALELGGCNLPESTKENHARVISKLKPKDKRPDYRYKILCSETIKLDKKLEDGELITDAQIADIVKQAMEHVEKWTKKCKNALLNQ